VADLSINDLIGLSHRNLGRFISVNEHCSFTPVNRPIYRDGKSAGKSTYRLVWPLLNPNPNPKLNSDPNPKP